jgi:hypothetical protein
MAPQPSGSPLHRLVRRLTASTEELEADRLQRDSARSGCAACAQVERGQMVTLSGRLHTVVYTPRTNLPTLEAELFDGSGTVTLVWLGRRRIAGVEPGRALTVRGRIALRDDCKIIYNPYYELSEPR